MEQYTQPLITQVDALSDANKNLILHRLTRLFPEIVQYEIKSLQKSKTQKPEPIIEQQPPQPNIEFVSRQSTLDPDHIDIGTTIIKSSSSPNNEQQQQHEQIIAAKLESLGWSELDDLMAEFSFDAPFHFGAKSRSRRKSEKQCSDHVEKQLNAWKKEKAIEEIDVIQKIKQEKKKNSNKKKIGKNQAEKVMLMMGIQNVKDNERDIEAICNASTKARRKLI